MRQLISQTHHVKHENCHLLHATQESSSSRMRVINRNWSATKQRPHPQSVAEISHHSVLSGQDSTMWDIVWVSPQGHRSVSVSRHFLLQAPQCPCSVRKRFSRDHCCRGRSKPGCRIVGSHTRWELTTWADLANLPSLLDSTRAKTRKSVKKTFKNDNHEKSEIQSKSLWRQTGGLRTVVLW